MTSAPTMTSYPRPPAPPPRRGWTAGRVVALISGLVLLVVGLAPLVAGAAMMGVSAFARDADGYLSTPAWHMRSNGYAVVVQDVTIGQDDTRWSGMRGPMMGRDRAWDGTADEWVGGHVRLTATAASGQPVFVGIAPSADVGTYLAGVARSVSSGGPSHLLAVPGGAPSGPPSAWSGWTASVAGAGTQHLMWAPQPGDWSVVVMNADASAPVAADVRLGARMGWLPWVAAGALLLGLVVLAAGATLVAVPAVRASRESRAQRTST